MGLLIASAAGSGTPKGAAPFAQPWQSGRYYWATNFISVGISQLSVGLARAVPLWVPAQATISRIGGEITVVGDAGSKIRFAIYDDDGTGRPGALILDAGTIAGDSATVQEIVVNQAITPGLHWMAAVSQLVTVTEPTVRVVTSAGIEPALDAGTAIPVAGAVSATWNLAGVVGAFPGTYAGGVPGNSSIPRVFIKAA